MRTEFDESGDDEEEEVVKYKMDGTSWTVRIRRSVGRILK